MLGRDRDMVAETLRPAWIETGGETKEFYRQASEYCNTERLCT